MTWKVVTPQTGVSLGGMATIGAIIIWIVNAAVASRVSEIKHENEIRFMEIRELIDDNTKASLDRYSLSHASEDAFREAIGNPGHKVPDPRNPGQYIIVEGTLVRSKEPR